MTEPLGRRFAEALGQPIAANGVADLLGATLLRFQRLVLPPDLEPPRPCLVVDPARHRAFWIEVIARVASGASLVEGSVNPAPMERALALMAAVAPETAIQVRRWLPRVLIVRSAEFDGLSHPHAFGCALLAEELLDIDPRRLAVRMVHELAHHELFLLNLVDRLMPKRAEGRLAHAPLQGRPRDPIGRLHAAHALFRMAQTARALGLHADEHLELLVRTGATFSEGELTEFAFELLRVQLGGTCEREYPIHPRRRRLRHPATGA